ncbi:MAG: hypothetical protein HY891_04635 [Deltaproteobacteria bacterium]|nr:hypothetical protein [Deltaproteobacteria bacterium]
MDEFTSAKSRLKKPWKDFFSILLDHRRGHALISVVDGVEVKEAPKGLKKKSES